MLAVSKYFETVFLGPIGDLNLNLNSQQALTLANAEQ